MGYLNNSRWLWVGLIVLLVYPATLTVQIMWDYLVGDSAFLDYYLYESRRRLLKIVLIDWLHSLLLIVPATLIYIICRKYMPRSLGLPIILIAIVLVFATTLWSSAIPAMLGLIVASAALPAVLIDWSNNNG